MGMPRAHDDVAAAVGCAAGHGCSVVCVICMFTAVLLSTHGWVCARGGGETQIHDRKYNMIRTIDAKVLNPNDPPDIFVRNGDAAHNSSQIQVINYIYIRSRPRNDQLATAVRRRWMCHTRTVLPAGGAAGRQFFSLLCSLRVDCAHGCVHKGKKQTEQYLWVWYARKGCSTIEKCIPHVRAHDAGCCGNPGICLVHAQGRTSSKGLPRATHCTDRAQTSGNTTPTIELCPPTPNVSDKGASTKRCARRRT